MAGHTDQPWQPTVAIEIPGADYPPSEEFTEDLENEDVPPEKLPKGWRYRKGGRGRLGANEQEAAAGQPTPGSGERTGGSGG